METNFKKELRQYIIYNYQYDPALCKEAKSIRKKFEEIKKPESLNYPKNGEIASSFIYHALKILDENAEFKNEKRKQIFPILSDIYLFFENEFDFAEYIMEQQIPFKFSNDLINCFENRKDFAAFQVFNLVSLLNKNIDEKNFQSMNFILLDILILYEYIFTGYDWEEGTQIIVAKIISFAFKHMIQFQDQNKFISTLNTFFFYEGKDCFTQFLKPQDKENKESAKNIFSNIIDLTREIINKEIKSYDKIPNSIFLNLETIKTIPLIEQTNAIIDKLNSQESNKIEEPIQNLESLNNKNKELDKEVQQLKIKVGTLCEDNLQLEGKVAALNKTIEELSKDKIQMRTELNKKIEELSKDKIQMGIQVTELSGKIQELSNDKIQMDNQVTQLTDQINILSNDKKGINKAIEENIEPLIIEINRLKNIIEYRNLTISLNEQKIESQKEAIISSNKQNKELSNKALNLSVQNAILGEKLQIKEKAFHQLNQDKIALKNENQIIINLNKNLREHSEELEFTSFEKVLIGSRDFLKLIINDLCFYFDVECGTDYIKVVRKLIEVIASKVEIKAFIDNVYLIEFLDFLGKVVEKMDNTAHALFPELSFKYRNTNINNTEEDIKNNINKCMDTFGKYVKKDFKLLTKFFIDYYKYPLYTKNNKVNNKGEKKYLFEAIKNYENDFNLRS